LTSAKRAWRRERPASCVYDLIELAPGEAKNDAARGSYAVIRQLPERDGPLEYQIKILSEPHERVVKESDLSSK